MSVQEIREEAVPGDPVFRQDGVVCLKGALGAETMKLAREAYEWSLANPGPHATHARPAEGGESLQDRANPEALDVYRPLVGRPEFAALLTRLWGKREIWYMYEQVFKRTGGPTGRTPWHQDTSYLPVDGEDLAVFWISFEPLTADQSLEFVRGSHRGTLHDGSIFDPKDPTIPLYGDGSMPRLPDIEKNRAAYDIVSFAVEPGDVVAFHPSMLHGGAATDETRDRNTLSLRFFGEEVHVAARPQRQIFDPNYSEGAPKRHPLAVMREQPDGSAFRHPDFPQISA